MNENVNNQTLKREVKSVFGFGSGTAKPAGQTPIKSKTTPMKSGLSSSKKLFTTSHQIGTAQNTIGSARTPLKQLQHSQSSANLHGDILHSARSTESLTTPSKAFLAKEMAKQAKIENSAKKIQKTKELKEKWAREKAEKLAQAQQMKQEKLTLARKMQEVSAQQQKEKMQRVREAEAAKKEAAKAEVQMRLQVERESKEARKREKAENRRKSILAREYIRKQQLKAEEAKAIAVKEAEAESIEAKREDMMALRKAQKRAAKSRRESLQMRGIISVQHKKLKEEEKKHQSELEREQLEMKRLDAIDVQNFKKACDMAKRQSLEARNEVARQQREMDQMEEEVKKQQIAADLEDKYQDWLATQQEMKQEKQSRRDSLARRNDYYFTHVKSVEARARALERESEEVEAALRQQEHEDVAEYRRQQEASRRESLAHRLYVVAKEHKDVELQQKQMQQILDQEDARLKEEDRQDVQLYKQQLLNERRQSLINRGVKKAEEAILDEQEHQAKHADEVEELQRKHEDWLDVQEAVREQREAKRQSLAARLVKSKLDKEMDLMAHQDALAKMHEEFALKRQGQEDVDEYRRKEKQNRRKSLQMRLQSHKEQKLQELMQKQQEDIRKSEDMLLKQQDREELNKYKLAMKQKSLEDMLVNKPWN